ncbi:SDR family oxidoreductase [Alkalicoccus luteus]|nr:SDR family oxidoreductase [Alkalicoccus luteus]
MKNVLITGAASGIGLSCASFFAAKGAHVLMIDKSTDVKERSEELEGSTAAFVCNVGEENEIKSLFSSNELPETLDVIINNAGISTFHPFETLLLSVWNEVIASNLTGVMLMSQYGSARMSGGTIINISSTRATMSEPDSEAYAASKGGVTALTHALAASLSSEGITVNAISPGWIDTEGGTHDDYYHRMHWSGRIGRPEDIASLCWYLSKPENNFINGEEIKVDGGMTRKMRYD